MFVRKVCQSIGIIVVDGKPYPQQQTQQPQIAQGTQIAGVSRQPPSPNMNPPNMAPPLRPGLQPSGMPQISPGHASIQGGGGANGAAFQNGPQLYNSASQQQQFNNAIQMSRQFANEAHGKNNLELIKISKQKLAIAF